MKGGRVWRGYAIPLNTGGVVLDPRAAAAVLSILRTYSVAVGPRDGIPPGQVGGIVGEVFAACEVAGRRSDSGLSERTSETDRSVSGQPDDLLTTAQVAEELNVTDRHARRLACSGELGDVTYVGRAIQVLRVEVDAHRARRSR